jgi:acyl-CoA reductase-like NAD-dependent aldehyde dehydrogenase
MKFNLLLDGVLVDGIDTLDVIDPATGRTFATAPRADAGQVESAIAAAKHAFPGWSARSYADRGAHLTRFADAMEARFDALTQLLTQEQGKPLQQSQHEVGASIAAFRHFATRSSRPEYCGRMPSSAS